MAVVELAATTLDKFAGTHPLPDFIKIDVEGEEGSVLVGAQSLLQGKKPNICCEIHNKEAARVVQRTLASHGYRMTTLDGRPFQLGNAPIPGEVQILAFRNDNSSHRIKQHSSSHTTINLSTYWPDVGRNDPILSRMLPKAKTHLALIF